VIGIVSTMPLRVIAGELKGRKIRTVRGIKTRPTADRTREAIFNILAFQIAGSRILDLFAGTGAFGIEALSRGADSAVFIDNDRKSISTLNENIQPLALKSQATVLQCDLTRDWDLLRSLKTTFDLIFMDPPYNKEMIAPTLFHLHTSHFIDKAARVVVEHSILEPLIEVPAPFEIAGQRRYGKTLVTFLDYVL